MTPDGNTPLDPLVRTAVVEGGEAYRLMLMRHLIEHQSALDNFGEHLRGLTDTVKGHTESITAILMRQAQRDKYYPLVADLARNRG